MPIRQEHKLIVLLAMILSYALISQFAYPFTSQFTNINIASIPNTLQLNTTHFNQYNNSNINISQFEYASFDRNHPNLYIVAGLVRSGSTVLYNILRILIRNKIDPNLLFGGAALNNENINKFDKQNFAILLKSHWDCPRLFKMLSATFTARWNIYIFTTNRKLSDEICSEILFNMMTSSKAKIIARCKEHKEKYFSCRNHKYFTYAQNYDLVHNKNISRIIYEIASVLNISHILSNNDRLRIEYELNHLIQMEAGLMQHPLTFIHPHHIHTETERNKTCNMEHIMDAITSDATCNAFDQYLQNISYQNNNYYK